MNKKTVQKQKRKEERNKQVKRQSERKPITFDKLTAQNEANRLVEELEETFNPLQYFEDPSLVQSCNTHETTHLSSSQQSNRAGDSYDQRVYSPGDDTRFIDWKVYARTERYYIRQRERMDSTPVNIILYFTYLLVSTNIEKLAKKLIKLNHGHNYIASIILLWGRPKPQKQEQPEPEAQKKTQTNPDAKTRTQTKPDTQIKPLTKLERKTQELKTTKSHSPIN